MDKSMWPAFIMGHVALTLLLPPLLMWLRSRIALLQAQFDHAWQEALTRGIIDDADGFDVDDALPAAQRVR